MATDSEHILGSFRELNIIKKTQTGFKLKDKKEKKIEKRFTFIWITLQGCLIVYVP